MTFQILMAFFAISLPLVKSDMLPYECEKSEQVKLIYVENRCNTKGIVVYAKSRADNPELCYKVITCKEGYLTLDHEATVDNWQWKCDVSRSCSSCPNWAAGCSHYEKADLNETLLTQNSAMIESPPKLDEKNRFLHNCCTRNSAI